MTKFEVVLELEIDAATPAQAATIARDMMLDETQLLLFDVHPFAWCEGAEEYFPDHGRGWQARFERTDPVRPADMIEWERSEP